MHSFHYFCPRFGHCPTNAVGDNGETSEKSAVSQVKICGGAEAMDSDQRVSWKFSEEWIQKTKNPVSWFRWGADLRAREEYIANAQNSLCQSRRITINESVPCLTDIEPVDYFSFHTRATYAIRNLFPFGRIWNRSW